MGIPQSHFQLPINQYLQERPVNLGPFDAQLKILSWNILAERLVSRSHFPYVNPAYLSYRYRIDLVKRLIERMDCSVLALQEVDPTQCFFSFLSSLGYEYHYRPKGCFQGILIAYKKSQFQLLQTKVVDYDSCISPKVRRFPYATGHGALFLKLLYQGKYKVVVGNTHLHWVPRHYKVKYHQTCTALSELGDFSNDDPHTMRFLMGDFNSLPDCNAVRLITHNDAPFMKVEYDEATYREMCLKYSENKHRIFRMRSALEDCMPYTNFTDSFKGTIDYMFYQESSRLQVKDVYNCAASDDPLPNRVFPSDHVPLICTFGLKDS